MAAGRTTDSYIEQFPDDIRELLNRVRNAIREAIPAATETISYGMPAFRYGKAVLVYFAAHKKHIGFYPTASGIETFQHDLSDYVFSKGAIQFPYEKPLPLDLIGKIAIYRMNEVKATGKQ